MTMPDQNFRALFIGVLIVLSGGLPASSQSVISANPPWSCGRWTQERSQPLSRERAQQEYWIIGYVSGFNVARNEWAQSFVDLLEGIDAAGVYGWIDNYCQSNPIEPVNMGVSMFVLEVTGRALRRKGLE
jgi:hypothetical protein